MTLAIIMSGMALFISGATFLTVLALLGRRSFQYATRQDVGEVRDRMSTLGRNLALLWRHMEAIDDHTGGWGHRLHGRQVHRDNPPA